MLKKFITATLVGAVALVSLTSCGSKASGTGEFSTVFAVASPPSLTEASLDVDLVSWTDAAGSAVSACTVGATPTLVAKTVENYTITSKPYSTPNTGSSNPTVPSDLVITEATLTLNPANTETAALATLPARFQSQPLSTGQVISPGTSPAIPVELVSSDLKQYLAGILGLGTACNNQILSYYAVVTFKAKEISTDRVATLTAPSSGVFIVRIGDFVKE